MAAGPKTKTKTKPVLGIDFGTSNSAAAWVDDNGRVRVAAVRQDAYLLPSVAWFSPPRTDDDPGNVLVGQPAKQQLVEDPKNTVFGFKRFLGLRYNSPFVHRYKDRFAYELVEGPDGLCAVNVQGRVKPLEDVAVDILKRLLELAAVSHGARFEECCVAVPAHFGFGQRAVIRRAAARAGVRVRGMVNEPTAAAMYYARQKGRDGTVLIFDLGGGTFDATLMAIVSGVVKVVATGGDAFLGGADFDHKIVDHFAKRLADEKGFDVHDNTVAIQRVLVAAEAAKIELSTNDEVRVRVPCVALVNERFVDLDGKLTKKELEDMTAPLVEKCVGVCEDILKRANLQPLEVDEVVLVGGMTRMPMIRRRLGEIFVTNKSQAIHPDLGVVVGTALYARGADTLIDVNSMSIGVTLPGGVFKELVPANTPVPSVQRLALERPAEGQPLVFGVFEAVDATSLERAVLGTVRVPPEWLKARPGPVTLEAFLGSDLEVTLFVVSSQSERLPVQLQAALNANVAVHDGAAASAQPARGDTKLAHPGFRSVALQQAAQDRAIEKTIPSATLRGSAPATSAAAKGASTATATAIATQRAPDVGPNDPTAQVSTKTGSSTDENENVTDATAPTKLRESRESKKKDDNSGPSIKRIKLDDGDKARGPARDDTGDEASKGAEEAGAPQPGDVVGGYLLLDVIGRGGMGRVYLAEHKRLGRRVALKMLRRRMVKNPTAVERFLSEARAVNQIRHENIIEVTDLFETEDGHLCTIMEVLEGRSLAGLLKSVKAVRPERAVRIGYQVAAALVAVHDAHIVHRDIKPENIFLTSKAGRDDFVKLLDFGVAKLIDTDGKSLHDTGIGATVGTRDYMSPEQLVGQNVDHRADIFSIGVVLYETLAGKLPFVSDTDRGMLFAQLEKPTAPSELVGLPRPVPADLSALVMQCLENGMKDRPQTMREVKGRLEQIADSLARGGVEGGSPKERAFVKGGLDVFAMEAETTAPDGQPMRNDDSLPEADAADVLEAAEPVETTRPEPPSPTTAPVSSRSTPPTAAVAPSSSQTPSSSSSSSFAPPAPVIVKRGIHPGAVVALMAATAFVTLALAWMRFH